MLLSTRSLKPVVLKKPNRPIVGLDEPRLKSVVDSPVHPGLRFIREQLSDRPAEFAALRRQSDGE